MDFLHLINVRRAISALQGQNIGVLYKTRDCHQTKGIMLLQHDFRININSPSYGYNKKRVTNTGQRGFLLPEWQQYVALSDWKQILIFPPWFSVIPRKISAYLRTDSSSGANTRIMEAFNNILNINNLRLRDILSLCKKHHFGMRNGPFQGLKSTISHPNIGFFACWNGLFRKAKWIFSSYVKGYVKWLFGLKEPLFYRF